MQSPRRHLAPRLRMELLGLGLALLAGCECGPGRQPLVRRDVGPLPDTNATAETDAGGDGLPDAWLDPDLDADLDAFFDPFLVDANLIDADLDADLDAFAHDAGAIAALDAGGGSTTRDAGTARDTGPDAQPPTGACGILWSRGDPLPSGCLPRCSAASRDLFGGCFGDQVCEATVYDADTTRTGLIYVWEDRDVSEVDCAGCVGTQRFSCWHVHCGSQAEAWVDCLARRGSEACMREQDMLQRCLTPYMAELDACNAERVAACFPAR